jgi:hypothetical protein
VHDYMEPPGSPELEEAYKLYVSEPDVSNGRRTLGSGAVTARERTAPDPGPASGDVERPVIRLDGSGSHVGIA